MRRRRSVEGVADEGNKVTDKVHEIHDDEIQRVATIGRPYGPNIGVSVSDDGD